MEQRGAWAAVRPGSRGIICLRTENFPMCLVTCWTLKLVVQTMAPLRVRGGPYEWQTRTRIHRNHPDNKDDCYHPSYWHPWQGEFMWRRGGKGQLEGGAASQSLLWRWMDGQIVGHPRMDCSSVIRRHKTLHVSSMDESRRYYAGAEKPGPQAP